MKTVTASAVVPATPDEVFAFVADLENLPRWQTGIVSAELTTPGPIGAGSRAHVVRELLGQRLAVDLALVDHQPGRRLELTSATSGIGVRAILELAPEDGATRLAFTMEIKAQNMFMTPVEGMVAGAAERDIADSLARVRSYFPAETPPAG
ncbi:MAG TPA: SRPBCC family protein [Candidatus Limnocylindria bacterium]